MTKHTPGPWSFKPTGDHKRIVIGEGLVEGPNGYDVAEVYSDDCDYEEALANARLTAAAPDLLDIAKRWAALDGGAWDVQRHAAEKRDLISDTQAAITKAESR